MAAQMGCTPRTIQQDVQIATQLSEPVKAALGSLPIADRKADLLRLSRLSPEGQAAIVQELTSGRVTTFEGARRSRAAKRPAPARIPATPQSSETQTPGVTTGDGPLNGHDRQTLVSLLVGRLKEVAVIAHGQIGGRPAVTVLAARLAAMPWPELALIAGCLTGTPEEAAAAWMAAVRGDTDADAAIMEDDPGDGSLADGPTAALPMDEDQRLSSPSLPWPGSSLDGVTPTTRAPDDGEATAAPSDETCSAGTAEMTSRASHARGPEAGTEVLHIEPGEHAEASTRAIAERPLPCSDVGDTPEAEIPDGPPQACMSSPEGGDGVHQASPHDSAEAANGVGSGEEAQVGLDEDESFAPQAVVEAAEVGGPDVAQASELTPAQRVCSWRQHVIAQIRRFAAEGAAGHQEFVRRLNEAGEQTPNGKGRWDGPQYKRFARQYGLPV